MSIVEGLGEQKRWQEDPREFVLPQEFQGHVLAFPELHNFPALPEEPSTMHGMNWDFVEGPPHDGYPWE